ncbi:methylmalonyl-CoA mutase family protein [Cytobacillus oceanisediminis]|uniref:methylmalonyl-CoA mutase family protein n=1 Tax=Cytobacillus oceanisediminis TaxID=665099 RepID=UPI0023DBE39E|nr:methylmalonyl-CoA mutase family protein [Cytobacillus oceanisediminis]MDF2038538.1 methylmalonyl-CoA mutase family protein [Cytobacillus oceanisediminis]
MSLKKMIQEKFPQQSIDDWEQSAEKALKGKSIESLSRNTYENIKLKPLYSKEDLTTGALSQYPGAEDFRRGSYAAGYLSEEWKVAQKINASSSEELADKLLAASNKGQTALAFEPEQLKNPEKISVAVGELYEKYPFSVDAGPNQHLLIAGLGAVKEREKVSGYIAADPLAIAAADSLNDRSIDELYENLNETVSVAAENLPSLKTIMVNSAVYHNGGANAVQELAFSLAAGVNHLQYFLEKGKSTEEMLSKMVFKFAVGSNFFMEIAKLRAARVLWGKVAEAYGAEGDSKKMVISAETSFFTKSAYDSYVNMLRAGNEAFAAVLGGVQYLHVSPYNDPEGSQSPFSERIARNTQLILMEEAHLLKVSDPAGGSWYIEHLTNELISKSWELFLEIEEQGGMADALQTGWVQDQISQVLEKKKKDVHTRKQSIIGTNIYANPDEKPLQTEMETVHNSRSDLKSIPQVRLSETFEGLRSLSERLKGKGIRPESGLICLGALKDHKARADFISGFLAPGGVDAVKSGTVYNPEDAEGFIQKTNCRHYFICGSNEQYESMAVPLIKQLKEAFPSAAIYLAGLPEDRKKDEYKSAGISGYIHVKSDCYETLLNMLNEMEAASNGQ